MTIQDFIDQCERTMGTGKVRLMPEQRAVYYQKLRRFTDAELSAIYDKVLEVTEHFPKIKSIYEAAEQLGYLNEPSKQYQAHAWEPTDCRLCGGEGRLMVHYSREFEKAGDGVFLVERLEKIGPYTKSTSGGYIFRCSCLAGDLPTIEKGLPRWSTNMPAVRRRSW